MPDANGKTPPTIIVIFGASGDLTARKLAPAIFNLSKDGLLPESCYLIGYGRTEMSVDSFREYLRKSLDSHSRRSIEEDTWSKLAANVSFHAGSYDDLGQFQVAWGENLHDRKGTRRTRPMSFLRSTPLGVFMAILENLGASGLAKRHQGQIPVQGNYRKTFRSGFKQCTRIERGHQSEIP